MQRKDNYKLAKTKQEGQDNLSLGKTIQGKGRQFRIVYQALNSPERQLREGQDKSPRVRQNTHKAGQLKLSWQWLLLSARQFKLSCKLPLSFGKTNVSCLAGGLIHSARQNRLSCGCHLFPPLRQFKLSWQLMISLGKTILDCLAELV